MDTAQHSSGHMALIVIFVRWVYHFFVNEEKNLLLESRFHTTISQLTRFNVEWIKDFIKIDDFQVFPVLLLLLLEFTKK